MAGPMHEEEMVSLRTLSDESGAPFERLEEMERLLREKGQMILYGPPGTGKTWLALRLATYLSGGDESRREIVRSAALPRTSSRIRSRASRRDGGSR